MVESPRDWVDCVKFVAELIGPVATAIFAYLILKATNRLEHSQWRNQKLIERRIEAWDKVAERINGIFCYCMRVGNWKDVSPLDVIAWKREVDRNIHIQRPYFSSDFFERYTKFMETCYSTYQGHGVDAKINVVMQNHKTAYSASWLSEWEAMFSGRPSTEDEIKASYAALQEQISRELGTGTE